jgi:hypothetical protein
MNASDAVAIVNAVSPLGCILVLASGYVILKIIAAVQCEADLDRQSEHALGLAKMRTDAAKDIILQRKAK